MKYWIWLSHLKGVGPVMQKRLLEKYGSPKGVYDAELSSLLSVQGIGKHLAEQIVSGRSFDEALKIIELMNKKGCKVLTIDNALYPKSVAMQTSSPIVFYYKGEIIPHEKRVGVVGSRRCSQYGRQVALEAGQWLGENGYAVISGMAKGIDGYAHIGCLKASGYTMAFLGTGIDICYPKEHTGLMEKIIERGAVISEYPPGTKGRAEFFPRRNYHISSWSNQLLVVEASENSGALITANIAKSQDREVYAVPSDIYRKTGLGCNQLIMNGAKIYMRPESFLAKDIKSTSVELISNKHKVERSKLSDYTEFEQQLIHLLEDRKLVVQEIAALVNMSQSEIYQHLSFLEIKGAITCISGRYTS